MEGKYISILHEIDKLPRKKTKKEINEKYETVKKEVDELLDTLE
jgi:DNA-binding cell septation regulator SpoVG